MEDEGRSWGGGVYVWAWVWAWVRDPNGKAGNVLGTRGQGASVWRRGQGRASIGSTSSAVL